MRSWLYYWRRCLWDFVRYNAFCGSQVSKLVARLSHLLRHPFARLSMLCRAARLYPTRRRRIFSLLSNYKDAGLLRLLSQKLTPVPLLASHWVDPDAFVPHLGGPKDYDLAMLAHFDPVKRHWLFFEALRKLPHRFRVLLMGV